MASPPPEFEKLAATRRRTLELIENVDQGASEVRPAKGGMLLGEAGKWSVGEIVDHILRVFCSLSEEIGILFELDARGERTVSKRTLRDYDVAPAMIPKPFMRILEPGFNLANKVSAAVLPSSVREEIMRNRVFPIQNPAKWIPVAGRGIEELRVELRATLTELEDLLKRETRAPLEDLILSHTVFGSNSVPQVLAVLEIHEAWHHKDLISRGVG